MLNIPYSFLMQIVWQNESRGNWGKAAAFSSVPLCSHYFRSLGRSRIACIARWFHYPERNCQQSIYVYSRKKILPFTLRWIPRSPRWLIANNHLEEAHEVLMKYATYNHVTVDSKHLKHMIQEVRKNDARKSQDEKYGILDTVKTPKLRKRSLIMFLNW